MKAFYLFSWLLGLSLAARLPAYAQQPAAPLVLGQTFTLASAALGETRRLNVYLPPVYADSPAVRLPVLYMPDGGMGEDFVHVAGLLQVLSGNHTMRPFILVGIENTQRRRDLTGPTTNAQDQQIAPHVGGSAAYRTFLRTELMPLVRQRYRTTAETGIVGESLAGLFVVETLVLEPSLFDTYLAFDPSVWWNNGRLVEQVATRLRTYAGPAKTLYVASSRDDQQIPASRRLEAVLRTTSNRQLTWSYQALPDETHATLYHPAALQAFRRVFRPRP